MKVIVIELNFTFILQYHIHEYSSKSVFFALGEYGLINKLKRQSTLSAKEDSEILVLSKGKYIEMLEKDPLLALLLSRICMVRQFQVLLFIFCIVFVIIYYYRLTYCPLFFYFSIIFFIVIFVLLIFISIIIVIFIS